MGLSISYIPGSAVTVSGGKGKTNTDSAYESVTEQAGIYAGKEGYDIQVKNNTRLKGAIIDSKAPAEKNKLTTGTLTWENIDNKAEYKTKASGITVSTNAVSKLNPLGLGYVPTVPVKGKAGSTTYAAIADSIITTTKEKTDKEISHDTTNALNTLSEIFDKKKIEEKQEYVNILSQVGYRLIGDIAGHKENELNKKAEKARKENNSILAEKYEKEAKKWSESGTNRIAMHGIMGALVSKEAGAGMTKGLTGAGIEMGVIYDLKNSNGSGTYILGGGNVGLSMMPLNITMAAIRIVPLDDKMRMDLQKPDTRKDIFSDLSIGGTLYVGVGGGFMIPVQSKYKDRVRVYVMGIGTPQGGVDAGKAQSLEDRADAMQSEIKEGSIIVD